jgi:hypothetical protein
LDRGFWIPFLEWGILVRVLGSFNVFLKGFFIFGFFFHFYMVSWIVYRFLVGVLSFGLFCIVRFGCCFNG